MTKKKKTRFMAISDIHSNINLVKSIPKKTNLDNIDFIIFTGDLSEKTDDFGELLEVFKDKQIFMVPGNHEGKQSLKSLTDNYKIHLIGNSPVLINEDIALFGTNYIPIGIYSSPEPEILQNMVENFMAVKDVKFKIQLNHLPPAGTKIGDASPYMPFISGSDALSHFLNNFEPDVTFVGHIHESSGLEEIVNKTRVINTAMTFKIFEFNDDNTDITEVEN